MLEQEIASIIKFVLDSAGNPAPYYWNVPRSFAVPAAYFPVPEIATGGETFRTYRMEYDWFINFFHRTTEKAYALALAALTALKENRNLVPLIDTDGTKLREGIRIKDPEIKTMNGNNTGLGEGVVQLRISFTSRRPYYRQDVLKMQSYYIENWTDQEPYRAPAVTEAMEKALEQYILPAEKPVAE